MTFSDYDTDSQQHSSYGTELTDEFRVEKAYNQEPEDEVEVGVEVEQSFTDDRASPFGRESSTLIYNVDDPEAELQDPQAVEEGKLARFEESSERRITNVVDKFFVEEKPSSCHCCGTRVALCIAIVALLIIGMCVALSLILTGVAQEDGTSPTAPTTDAPMATPVLELPISTLEAIEKDPNSPQARAFKWSQTDREGNPGEYSSERLLQRFSLATLFYATGGGTSWTNSTNWLSTKEHECNWFSSASREEYEYEVTPCASGSDMLTQLILSNNNLTLEPNSSGLPAEIFLLTGLTHLDLEANGITGSLSTEIANLQNLQWLRLGRNEMSGSLPSEIGSMSQLQVLSLYTNMFSGSLPASLNNATSLIQIWISSNQFRSTLPTELGLLSSLQIVWLDQNELTGTLPTEWALLSQLSDVLLNENYLSGTIPSEWGKLGSSLVTLDLRSNMLEGTLPTEIGVLTRLATLVLHENKLAGSIPSQIGTMASLKNLYMSSNRLTSSIPTEVGSCGNLTTLWLNTNSLLTGTIPTEIGQLTLLEELFLSRNSHWGTIPTEVGTMGNLKTLALQQNIGLTGNLPTELAIVRALAKVTLTLTSLSGVIPEKVCLVHEEALIFDCSDTFCGCGGCTCPA